MSNEPGEKIDHGRVVRQRGKISWAWLFPLLALGAALWMYAGYLRSLGPEIEVRFSEAPGIEAGKTHVIFRGVVAGKVTRVDLDEQLNQVRVKIRLESFAAGLAVDSTEFWIEQPVISLQGMTGISSLIRGNSIHASLGRGNRRTVFDGLSSSPVITDDQPVINVRLSAEESQTLERGAPVSYRGVVVGRVRQSFLDEQKRPFVDVDIEERHRDLLRTTSRFWVVPATKVALGPGGIELEFGGLDSLVQGAVAFDDFGSAGQPLVPGESLALLPSEDMARAAGEEFVINFPTARGVRAGHTRLVYLGLPVGMVSAVRALDGRIEVRARLEPRYERMRAAGSTFTLVEPQISLQGVTGLQTLITGVVIECSPGRGDLVAQFSGKVPAGPEEIKIESSSGLRVRLQSSGTHVTVGAPVIYRDLQVGEVLSKDLGRDGATVELVVGIEQRYASLVRQNSVFWTERALQGSIGFFSLNLEAAMPLGTGGVVKFATPDASAPRAKAMAAFTLNAKPRREWTKWDPAIPLNP